MNSLRILFWGMSGVLSRRPLAALLAAGGDVCGVVLPADRVPPFQLPAHAGRAAILPVLPAPPGLLLLPAPEQTPDPLTQAAQRQIPAFGVRDVGAADTAAALAALAPDVLCVSCFPRRLPPAILQLPRLGCLNLHPSLLPQFRGPAPLFWTFQRGVRQTGVTVHWMDDGLDTGAVALQRPLLLADGLSGAAAARDLAGLGGELLVDALRQLAAGGLPHRPQPAGWTADPWPRAADFALDTGWPVRRAFNFMRGTAEWERPYPVVAGTRRLQLRHAIAFDEGRALGAPLAEQADAVAIQFADGVLLADTP